MVGDRSPCCNAPIIRFMSLNKKMCADCLKYFEWPLKDGQQPLVKHTR